MGNSECSLTKSLVKIRWQIPRKKKRLPAKKVFDHEEIVQEEGGLLLPISPSRGNFEGGQLPKIYESDHCARFEGALNSDPYFESIKILKRVLLKYF